MENIKLVVLGDNVVDYLNLIKVHIEKNDFECMEKWEKEKQDAAVSCQLEISDHTGQRWEIECCCIEIDPKCAMKQLERSRDMIASANKIINIIPIKWFPKLRYNLDENWEGIDSWDSVNLYIRTLRRICGNSAKVMWIYQGIEKMSVTSSFFQKEENKIVMRIPTNNEIEEKVIDDIMERFFQEIEESNIWEEQGGEQFSFGFDVNAMAARDVGIRAVAFWIVRCLRFILKIFDEDTNGT